MKKLILAAVIALSMAGVASAQSHKASHKDSTQTQGAKKKDGKGDKKPSFKHLDKLKTDLGLSDDQVKKLKEQQAQTNEKIKAVEGNASLDDAAKKKQIKDLKKQNKDNMKSVLTKEQQEKLKAMGKQHKDKEAE